MRQACDIDRDGLRPPGALLARALAAWPAERRQRLRHDLGVTAAGLDMLLLGARPPSEADIVVIGAALGVPAAVLREREETFARWAGALVPAPQPLAALGRGRDIEPLFSPREIARRVAALALEISDRVGSDLLIAPILKGAFVFAADLVRFLFALGIDPQVEFVEVGSYGDRHERADMVEGQPLPAAALAGRTVLLLDDICDTGLTFATLAASARALGARRVLTCALIDKRERRAPGLARFRPDYTGFSVARGWVVGYGMDDGGRLRGSPEIAMLRPAAAAEPPALSAPAQPQG